MAESERSELKRIMADLEKIEFETGSDLRVAAHAVGAALGQLPPGDGERRLAMRKKAKAVARHLHRAAEAQQAVGVQATRTWGSLHKHFEHLVKRKKRKRVLDLSA